VSDRRYRRKGASPFGYVDRLAAGRPISAMLELADRCNEVCVHCYQVQGQKGELATDDWRKILDELADLGVLFLVLSGGEVTLRKDFLDLVAYARSKRFATKIYTNGLTMTPALARRLAELGVFEVQISLYSTKAEVHDWVTRVPGSFDKSVAGIRALREVGIAVVMKSPMTQFNLAERAAYQALAAELDVDFTLDPQVDAREDGTLDPQAFRLSMEQYREVLEDLATPDPEVGDAPILERQQGAPCGACAGNIHVEANGELRPCTLLDVPVGNAVTDGIARAYETHPDALAIRALTWADLHGCRDCDLQPYCGRCYANAKREGGDALGPYAGACQKAKVHYELLHGVRLDDLADEDVGPYRRLEGHRFEAFEDRLTEEDRARREAMPWALQRPDDSPPLASAGQLVQLRRPGARRAAERVPAGDAFGGAPAGDDFT
jgi:radical SAM protein with 4Fe4S-binding SPASM domain